MKFRINTNEFFKAVKSVAVIATKNTMNDFRDNDFLSLEASPSSLLLKAYGGTSSITYTIAETEGYTPIDSGGISVFALQLQFALGSIPLDEELSVSIDNDQLKMAPYSDEDNFISIRIDSQTVINAPNTSKKNDQMTVVNREYFVKGLQKVKFAPTQEEKYRNYMCVLFESQKNSFKFSAGTGGRFAIVGYDGKKVSTNKTKLLFPSINITNIINVLKHSDDDTIKIRSVGKDCSKRIPEQIVIETGSMALAIYGLEHFTKYPDLSNVFNYNYPYRISFRVKDWKYAIEAIAASRHFHNDSIHNTRITADLIHGYFELETNTAMKMNKKIPFEREVFVADSNKDKDYKPWFCCNSDYFREIFKVAGKDDIIIINFKDQSDIDGIDDEKQIQEIMKPIMIQYPEKTHKDKVTEKFYFFFSISTMW